MLFVNETTPLRLGRLVEPLPNNVGLCVHSNPTGLIPKPPTQTNYPRVGDVNAGISEEATSISYMHIEHIVECI